MGRVRYGVVFCNPQYSAKYILRHIRDCVVLFPFSRYITYVILVTAFFVHLRTRYMTCVMLVTTFRFVSLHT